jgi:hypothetical protein
LRQRQRQHQATLAWQHLQNFSTRKLAWRPAGPVISCSIHRHSDHRHGYSTVTQRSTSRLLLSSSRGTVSASCNYQPRPLCHHSRTVHIIPTSVNPLFLRATSTSFQTRPCPASCRTSAVHCASLILLLDSSRIDPLLVRATRQTHPSS